MKIKLFTDDDVEITEKKIRLFKTDDFADAIDTIESFEDYLSDIEEEVEDTNNDS